MGAKLTKSKNLSILEKTKEQQSEIPTTVESTNNHLDITTNEDNKQTEKNKNKKKKEQKLNKKSSETKVDKSTNTERYVLPSSKFTEQLVDDQISAMNNNVLLNTNIAQINAAYQSEISNKDVQGLRETSFRNGIVSIQSHGNNQRTLNEQEYQANTLSFAEDATENTSITVVADSDQLHNNEQQQQSVKP